MGELRRERGLTGSDLARRAQVSPGQISNLERGRRSPTAPVAAACDEALGARGELIALASRCRSAPRMSQGADVEATVAAYSAILESLRDLGRTSGPRPVSATLAASARTLCHLAAGTDGDRARPVWLLAARFAEYAGWMAQESGDHAAALNWTGRAVAWGKKGGDEAIAAYALVRQAMISQHRGEPRAAVEFARQAAMHPAATPRIRAHATRREAQGRALLGDLHGCLASLDQCAGLLGEPADPASPQWGPRADGQTFRLIRASCLVTLRMFSQAADLFDAGLGDISASGNSLTRFQARQAVAYMGLGHPEIASGLLMTVMPAIERLDSATIRAELRHVLDEAARHQLTPGDHDVMADVAALVRAQLRIHMPRIFISFRKIDERWMRDRVCQALTGRFGASQFFRSGNSIPPGSDFAQVLLRQARECEVMLVLIGSRWLDASDETGRRLLDRDDDWVRREIAASISAGNRAVPVLLGDSTMLPGPSQLPPDIAHIGRLQFLRVPETHLDAALDDLIASVALLLPGLRAAAAPAPERPGPPAIGHRGVYVGRDNTGIVSTGDNATNIQQR
jgi:transcriptional regulator with XRE-family HTH domain